MPAAVITKKQQKILVDYTGYFDKSIDDGGITMNDAKHWMGRTVPFFHLHGSKEVHGEMVVTDYGMGELKPKDGILTNVYSAIAKLKNPADREVSLSMINIPGKLRELFAVAYVPGDGAREGARIIRK